MRGDPLLPQEQRDQIQARMKAGLKQCEIVAIAGVQLRYQPRAQEEARLAGRPSPSRYHDPLSAQEPAP